MFKRVETAIQKMRRCRGILVLANPFWGALSLRLNLLEDECAGTAWTDGIHIGFCPEFVLGLSDDETVGLIAHEVGHVALGHIFRRGDRDPMRWNYACDYSENYELRQAGFTLPKGSLVAEPNFRGRSAEYIYDRLPEDTGTGKRGKMPTDDPTDQNGSAPPPPVGEVRDAPKETAEGDDLAEAVKQAVHEAAEVARKFDRTDKGTDRTIKRATAPRVDWRDALARFAQEVAAVDYDWMTPDRRFSGGEIILPDLAARGMGHLVAVVDTSGSVDAADLGQFRAEIEAIRTAVDPEAVTLIYADYKVQAAKTFTGAEEIDLEPVGGGWTCFKDSFRWVAENLDDRVAALVYLTDLHAHGGGFPELAPDYPVLWAATRDRTDAPFGEVVSVDY